ncbi:MAG: hypothetical protein AUI10_01735 [Actinobacteria bacterium 13_2_20CM_2_72_6]|nr:MAG: hypothetical protein AUI10_01735 [Actinobacteria bacterium 13_2_20CM_2_72_6]
MLLGDHPTDDRRLGVDGPDPAEVIIPTVHVTDLDATIQAALAAGGEILVPRIPTAAGHGLTRSSISGSFCRRLIGGRGVVTAGAS